MTRLFDHFVITRFNVRMPWLSRFQAETRFCSPEWIRGRIELFDKYCFPSVAGQTCQKFRWLVYFDVDSPDFLREAIQLWQRCECFQPEYVDGFDLAQVRQTLRQLSNPSNTHILTTRLDSDDMLADNFVQAAQAAAQSVDHGFINMLHGFQLYGRHAFTVSHERNPFISLMEPIDTLATVVDGAHGDAHLHAQVIDVTEGRSWAQVIHGGNVANELDSRRERYPLWLAARGFSPMREIWSNLPRRVRMEELAADTSWAMRKLRKRIIP